ncbi:hypothetical protein M8J77_020629 [Diaphorina citri]|nr:hypothetical protein M8J77_020629 [Diaphorina citri]
MAKPDGSYTTNGEETLEVLLNAHFPEHRSAAAGLPSSGLNVELRSRPTERRTGGRPRRSYLWKGYRRQYELSNHSNHQGQMESIQHFCKKDWKL